jgi:hypothetical protein
MIIAVGFILFIIKSLFEASTMLVIGIAIALVVLMILSRQLKKHSIIMERTFMQNLNFRDTHDEFKGKKRPKYEGHLLSRDLHLSDFDIPADSLWAGYTLRELNLGNKYGVHVASIIRGLHRINIPGANVRLLPGDTIQVIGTDEQLAEFSKTYVQNLNFLINYLTQPLNQNYQNLLQYTHQDYLYLHCFPQIENLPLDIPKQQPKKNDFLLLELHSYPHIPPFHLNSQLNIQKSLKYKITFS